MNNDPAVLASRIRRAILEMSKAAGVGHIGSSLSVVELVAAVYGGIIRPGGEQDRDRFVLSKGHASLALYAALEFTGALPQGSIERYCRDETVFGVHPEPDVPGVDFATGSLGQGVSFGVGAALAARLQRSGRRIFVLSSDGELNEGVTWEALAFAGHHRLDSLRLLLDMNGQQALGYTADILDPGDVTARLRALGWQAEDIDGHDVAALASALSSDTDRPMALVAQTTFGRGVDFMEGKIDWHYLPMSEEQYAAAMTQLGPARAG